MIEQVKKAYYLKTTEFKILLAIMGAEELFGFQLRDTEAPEQIMLNQILFGMAKKGLVFADENGFIIDDDVKLLINEIIDAEKMLVISDRNGEYPEKCIYIKKNAVSIQICGQNNDFVRLEGIILHDLPKVVTESGFIIEQILSDYILYQDKKILNYEILELVRDSFIKSKDYILGLEGIKACMIVYSIITKKKELQILLVGKGIEDYIVVSDMNDDNIYNYSEKMIHNILKQCIGGVS